MEQLIYNTVTIFNLVVMFLQVYFIRKRHTHILYTFKKMNIDISVKLEQCKQMLEKIIK